MTMTAIVQELLAGEKRATGQADLMLETAQWAGRAFARFDAEKVKRIAGAAADAGFAMAGELAEEAVAETGFGVVEHKKMKNEMCSRGIFRHYADHDFCSKRVRADAKIVEIPRPAGVVFALTPSTNPICTVYFKIILALLTRNAIVVSPHPLAKVCSVKAARAMAEAAEAEGAPAGVVQVIAEPTLPLIDHVMRSPRVSVILATGGTPMVRAAYSSANPAIGVGPGNAPALVDETADLEATSRRLVQSKSFDNSVLCTNESVVVALEPIADRLLQALSRAGAYIAKPDEVAALRDLLYGKGSFNTAILGKSAQEIGAKASIRVPAGAKIIVAPIERVGIEEGLSKEKLCPVLGFVRVPHIDAGISTSRALVRMAGAGHSAAIHSKDPRRIMAFGAEVRALRVVVNAPCAQGAAGFGTHLAPSFTIGTGYFGRSSVGENIEPKHLVNWTRIAFSDDSSESMPDFTGIEAWAEPEHLALGRDAPMSLGKLQEGAEKLSSGGQAGDFADMREEIRRIVLEELRRALRK